MASPKGPRVPRTELIHPTTGEVWRYNKVYLEDHVNKGHSLTCWDWTGATHRQGYGMIGVVKAYAKHSQSGMMNAQRLILAIKMGRPLEHNEYAHAFCERLNCCNPRHLELKTSILPLPKDRTDWFTRHLDEMETWPYQDVADKFDISMDQVRLLKVAYRKWKAARA